jgi:pimeloyl-ACP methyl ester carboxylesterase
MTLNRDDQGKGDAVLLLHGFPCTRGLWRPVAERLVREGFRCIAPDLLGYGDSPSAANVGMAAQVPHLAALLDELGLASIHLVAHDVGTAAAQLFALEHRERVRSLLLMDSVHEGEWAMGPIESIRTWDEAKAARLEPVLSRRLRVVRELLQAYAGEDGGRRLIHAARCLDPRETVGATEPLRQSGITTRIVWGTRDEYLPLATVGRALAEALGADLVEIEAGHFAPLEDPDGAARAVLSFLREQAVRRT